MTSKLKTLHGCSLFKSPLAEGTGILCWPHYSPHCFMYVHVLYEHRQWVMQCEILCCMDNVHLINNAIWNSLWLNTKLDPIKLNQTPTWPKQANNFCRWHCRSVFFSQHSKCEQRIMHYPIWSRYAARLSQHNSAKLTGHFLEATSAFDPPAFSVGFLWKHGSRLPDQQRWCAVDNWFKLLLSTFNRDFCVNRWQSARYLSYLHGKEAHCIVTVCCFAP